MGAKERDERRMQQQRPGKQGGWTEKEAIWAQYFCFGSMQDVDFGTVYIVRHQSSSMTSKL
jgi:hypothetical protein